MEVTQSVLLRSPTLLDGLSVNQLIARCPPLDTNSSYCNFLQCSHFASSSVLAESNGEVVGFISGYVIPERPNTLFIWQVAVDEAARGVGLATKMLLHLIGRPGVSFLETTITQENKASWTLFRRLAARLSSELAFQEWIEKSRHFDGTHETEFLVRIGPFREQILENYDENI